eukprot:743572-Amphidinium_carterae.1
MEGESSPKRRHEPGQATILKVRQLAPLRTAQALKRAPNGNAPVADVAGSEAITCRFGLISSCTPD